MPYSCKCTSPSIQSLSGTLLQYVSRRLPRNLLVPASCSATINNLCRRIFFSLALLGCAIVDLLWWTCATITMISPYRIGCKNHLVNLVSTLAMLLFAFAMPFGYLPKINHARLFFKWTEQAVISHYMIQAHVPHNNAEEAFNELLNRNCNAQDASKRTPLIYNAQNMNRVSQLLNKSANPNYRDAVGGTPLAYTLLGNAPSLDPKAYYFFWNVFVDNSEEWKAKSSAVHSKALQAVTPPGSEIPILAGRALDLYENIVITEMEACQNTPLPPDTLKIAKNLILRGAKLEESSLEGLQTLWQAVKNRNLEEIRQVFEMNKQSLHPDPFLNILSQWNGRLTHLSDFRGGQLPRRVFLNIQCIIQSWDQLRQWKLQAETNQYA